MTTIQIRPEKNRDRNTSILLGLILLVTALILFPLQEVSTGPDATWYVANALNLHQGRGYVDADWTPVLNRGPVFPLLIAASFTLFGPSVLHAVWVVRTFFVLSIALVYLLGLKFYGKWPGFIAALLVLSSYQINRYASYVLVDVVLPFFILLFIYSLSWAFERKTLPWFLASGVILGIAFLVKEMTIVFVPLPFLLLLVTAEHRHRRELLLSLVSLGGFVLILLPWMIHILRVSGDISWLLGGAGPKVLAALSSSGTGSGGVSLIRRLLRYPSWLVSYYRDTVAANFVLAPLFLVAWAWSLVKGVIDRKPSDKLVLLAFLSFSPIMLFQGKVGWRVGQSIFIILLSYVAMARTVWDLIDSGLPGVAAWAEKRGRTISVSRLKRIAGVILVGILLVAQLAQPEMIGFMVNNSQTGRWALQLVAKVPGVEGALYRLGAQMAGEMDKPGSRVAGILESTEFRVRGWHNDTVREAGEWIEENIPSGAAMTSDWQWQRSIYFYAKGVQPIYRIPTEGSSDPNRIPSNPRILFLWAREGPNIETRMETLIEENLLQQIEENDIQYVIVTWRRNFMSLYFESHPGFVGVAEFGDDEASGKIVIYSIVDPSPIEDFPLHVDSAMPTYLADLQRSDEAAYRRLVEDYFVGRLDWTEEMVQDLVDGQLDFVPIELYQSY